jgi:putative ABC transport system permease protein
MKPTPPRWASRLLAVFCPPHLLEEVQGDVEERFWRRVERFGERAARRQYVVEVLGFLRPFALKRRRNEFSQPIFLSPAMIRNYFKIAWRNLLRHRTFSALNIAGLAIGIATCLVILLFVADELSYDRFHEKADRIVRVVFRGSVQGQRLNEADVMPPVAQALKADYPEVQEATRLREYGVPRVTVGNKIFRGDAFAFVDSNFFQVFTLSFVRGDARTALVQPNTVVISRTAANRYFGSTDPIGKTLIFKDFNATLKITGVIEPVPANSHFHVDLFASMASSPEARQPSWMTSGFTTYLVLPPGYDYRRLEAKLPQVVEKYMGPQIQQGLGLSLAQFRRNGNEIGFFLQPLTDIHLRSDFAQDLSPAGDIRSVYIFGAIALFMLLIACINFMNLSTASASKRAREVGIRKVMGSVRGELVRQFLLESLLLTAVALGLGVGLVYLALPVFNDLAGKNLRLDFGAHPGLLPGLLGFGLLVGVLAGGYPAFFLSSFKPVAVLKGRTLATPNRGRKISLRSGLIVFQFFISITLTVCTTVVYRQLAFIQNKKLGYEKAQVLVLPETWMLGKKRGAYSQQLRQDPRVVSVSTSGYLPAGPTYSNNFFAYPDAQSTQLVKTLRYEVDAEYIPTLGMQMAVGRNFSPRFGTDSTGVIVNETAAKAFGWGRQALGHTLTHSDNEGRKTTYQVIGVVKDFHFESLHERISPLVMTLGTNAGTMIVKVSPRDIAGVVAAMERNWEEFKAEGPFAYSFLDERFQATYRAEQKAGQILGIFAGLTIFVACLGLFGLATFTAEQRTKEIGVRKVLGASVSSIVGLLSKDFLKLVLVAMVLAAPIAGYAMHRWLQDFAYRIDLEWWMFALAGLLAVIIALLTVSFQSVKAALMNPVKSLRSE